MFGKLILVPVICVALYYVNWSSLLGCMNKTNQDNSAVTRENNIVKTTSGSVRGQTINVLGQKIEQYLGIPFAEPPIGSLRFSKPKPLSKPIEGIIDATKEKYSCYQPMVAGYEDFLGKLTQSEDCLTLNIWTQQKSSDNSAKLRPVMFWIYGGGLSVGSIFQKWYNGSVLATHEVVLVSVNYRLGQLGFLYGGDESAPGNVGFFDQLLGLKWVRDNIHSFGGDRNQITIFGESAGSWSVSAQLLSPLSNGLFKRAILQSGAHMYNKDRSQISREEGLNRAKELAKRHNCTDDKKWLDCLRKVEAKPLVAKGMEFVFPVDDTEFLPLTAHNAFNQNKFNKDLDIMAGVTKNEGSNLALSLEPSLFGKNLTRNDLKQFIIKISPMFHDLDEEKITDFYLQNVDQNDSKAILWKIFDFYGDFLLKCPTYLFAKRYAQHSAHDTNVFFYELTHALKQFVPGVDLGTFHGSDVFIVFGLPLLEPESYSEENIQFTKYLMKLWTDFAKYGKPDNNWPKLMDTKSHSSVTQIKDLNPKNSRKYINNLFDENCDGFWKNYY